MSQFSQGIKQVVASAKEIAGEKVLAAYYTKDKGSEIDKTELKAYLQSKLPEYMIPGFFVEVESIALTSNGKIDRKSLP
ncbi:AMP-binding enzyme, partial [Burkholderia sp. SIMBA_048]